MIDRLVIGFLVGSAVFGTLLFAELSDAAVDQPTALVAPAWTDPPPAQTVQRPRVEELMQTTLVQPLFSPSRRPPDRATADRSVYPELPNFRLTGIVVESERHLAIFAVPGGKPLARTEGETINEWRLESVSPKRVSLSGPSGTMTLEPKSDPHLARPKQFAQPGAKPGQPVVVGARLANPRAVGQPQASAVAVPPARAPIPANAPVPRANPTRPQ